MMNAHVQYVQIQSGVKISYAKNYRHNMREVQSLTRKGQHTQRYPDISCFCELSTSLKNCLIKKNKIWSLG